MSGLLVSDILPQLSIFSRLKGPDKWGSFFRSAQHWDYADGEIILGRLPENLSDLLRRMRERVPDVSEAELRDAIAWSLRVTKRKGALLERMMQKGCRANVVSLHERMLLKGCRR